LKDTSKEVVKLRKIRRSCTQKPVCTAAEANRRTERREVSIKAALTKVTLDGERGENVGAQRASTLAETDE
jgi:hypothetical protein